MCVCVCVCSLTAYCKPCLWVIRFYEELKGAVFAVHVERHVGHAGQCIQRQVPHQDLPTSILTGRQVHQDRFR